MFDWWTTLDLARQIFLLIALVSTFIVGLQLLMQIIGIAGADLSMGDLGSGEAGDHSAGFGFLSVRTVMAFTAAFGWTGYTALTMGAPIWLANVLATVIGVLMMLTVVWMMRAMLKLNSSGSMNYANAIGATGTVYVTIPANRTGMGQVEVQCQGRLSTVQAVSRSTSPLAPGTPVKVSALLEQNILVVEPLA